jgi:uncharacterized protein YegP (UPF0339 family)
MAGWYVLKSSGAQFMFDLKAGNGETILTSERYVSKQGAKGGIASVQANSPNDARYEKLTSRNGSPYFVLKAINGEVIGTSEMYSSTGGRDNGIASVKVNGPTTDVRDNA